MSKTRAFGRYVRNAARFIVAGGLIGAIICGYLHMKHAIAGLIAGAAAGILVNILIAAKNRQKKRKEKKQFEENVHESYRHAKELLEQLNDAQSEFSQIEMTRVAKLMNIYDACEEEINAGYVYTDIIDRLAYVTQGFEWLLQRNAKRETKTSDKTKKKRDTAETTYRKEEHAQKGDTATKFFAGCDTEEKVEARYKSLSRAFHPDSKGGDEEMFKKMKEEYDEIKNSKRR